MPRVRYDMRRALWQQDMLLQRTDIMRHAGFATRLLMLYVFRH